MKTQTAHKLAVVVTAAVGILTVIGIAAEVVFDHFYETDFEKGHKACLKYIQTTSLNMAKKSYDVLSIYDGPGFEPEAYWDGWLQAIQDSEGGVDPSDSVDDPMQEGQKQAESDLMSKGLEWTKATSENVYPGKSEAWWIGYGDTVLNHLIKGE